MIGINLTHFCNRNCDYCFAKGFLKRWPNEISLEKLEYIFKWSVRQGIKGIAFSGGEPTLFSKINSALDLARKYDLKVGINTNGTTDFQKINIKSSTITYFVVNLNPVSEYSSQELKNLNCNLKTLKKNFKKVIFRFNITSPEISYNYLINACERLNIRRVNSALVLPSLFNKNKYIKKEKLKSFSRYISQFVRDLLKHNIQNRIVEPLPLCLFSEKERLFLTKNSNLNGLCKAGENPLITPNMTVLPCSPLTIEGPSLSRFKNQKEIVNYYKEIIEKLRWDIDLFPQCKNCLFKKNKQCQGGCLVYKFFQAQDSMKLKKYE
jgi:radical SAM protein with 4Fe4S-binding SPASM domain